MNFGGTRLNPNRGKANMPSYDESVLLDLWITCVISF